MYFVNEKNKQVKYVECWHSHEVNMSSARKTEFRP